MGLLETTDTWTWADLPALANSRRDQPSFHLFSEAHLRGQIFNLHQSQTLGPLNIEGNLLIMGLAGSVSVNVGGDTRTLGPMCEMILNPGVRFAILANSDATIHLVWSPPFAEARPDSGAQLGAGAV
jgi:hypothetical protein